VEIIHAFPFDLQAAWAARGLEGKQKTGQFVSSFVNGIELFVHCGMALTQHIDTTTDLRFCRWRW